MTYDEIEAEQYRLARKFNTRRNSRGTWEKVLINRGWCAIHLWDCIRSDKIAVMTKDVGCPIVTISSAHASVVDNGKVVDSWDSRGKKVTKILVKCDFAEKVRQILFPQPKAIPHFM